MPSFDPNGFLRDLEGLIAKIPNESDQSSDNSGSKTFHHRFAVAIERLRIFKDALDPIKQPISVFDPSNPAKIGGMIAADLLSHPRHPLGGLPRFWGAGVYALYYTGNFDAYRLIRGTDHPIYIGKADPKSTHAKTPEEQGDTLSRRLGEHTKSIKAAAANLRIEDFACRYLVVGSAWQKAAEDHLIELYKPIWNNEMKICFGFGKHGDKATTRANKRSPWDTLHPGRAWAAGNEPNAKNCDQIKLSISEHFKKHPPIQSQLLES